MSCLLLYLGIGTRIVLVVEPISGGGIAVVTTEYRPLPSPHPHPHRPRLTLRTITENTY